MNTIVGIQLIITLIIFTTIICSNGYKVNPYLDDFRKRAANIQTRFIEISKSVGKADFRNKTSKLLDDVKLEFEELCEKAVQLTKVSKLPPEQLEPSLKKVVDHISDLSKRVRGNPDVEDLKKRVEIIQKQINEISKSIGRKKHANKIEELFENVEIEFQELYQKSANISKNADKLSDIDRSSVRDVVEEINDIAKIVKDKLMKKFDELSAPPN